MRHPADAATVKEKCFLLVTHTHTQTHIYTQ